MKKIHYSWSQVEDAVADIKRQLEKHDWVPDMIVGLVRGGAIPATLLSHQTGAPVTMLHVSLRDGEGLETNCWLAGMAFEGKKILIVDDINDSGATIAWIKQDWKNSCNSTSEIWDSVWDYNTRVAVLTNNVSSKETADYYFWTVDKSVEDCWLVYPWEAE